MFPSALKNRIQELERTSQTRRLVLPQGLDLCSNDYLGFASDSELMKRIEQRLEHPFALGSTGSRLIRGNLEIFEKTEALLADFCNQEAAILFPSGYQANLALLSCIAGPDDVFFSDEMNHGSLIDGMRLSRARRVIYPHCDLQQLESLLKSTSNQNHQNKGTRWIVTESVFSMDGDLAPLVELSHLAERYGAFLIVDEAHATGLWGKDLRGAGRVQSLDLSSQVFATVHPAGKSLGVAGAWIAGDQALKDYLTNFSRPFIFSTAPSPALAIFIQEAIQYWQEVGPARSQEVLARSEWLQSELKLPGLKAGVREGGISPIIPLLVKDNQKALEIASHLQKMGYDIRAIRPPTVPEGTARLRLTVTYNNSQATLVNFVQAWNGLRKTSTQEFIII